MSNTEPQKALAMFAEGYNCAQSVLAACGENHGLDRETAIKIGQAFGGGIGRTGNICGAVSGALMCIGLKYPVKNGGDNGGKEKAHALAQKFIAAFESRHGSIFCRDLLGCELLTAEGRKKAHDAGLFKERCPALIEDAATLIGEILADDSCAR